MYIKGKPIRFGYKIWSLCGEDGYPYKMNIYTGKNSSQRSDEPLGQRVVLNLLELVTNLSEPKYHDVYFDNFFSSAELLKLLSDQGFIATGTIRENRTDGATKLMISKKAMKKKTRGSYDYRCNGEIFVCKWHDNSIVNIASNHFTHEPVHRIKRRVRGQGIIEVTQPNIIQLYNKGMGGVVLMDRLLGSYRPMIRAKKWWWPLMSNLLNISIVSAWKFYCVLHLKDAKITHLEFRRNISLVLTKSSTIRNQSQGGRHADLPSKVRYDGQDHNLLPCAQGRCVVYQKNTRSKCSKCNLRLHYSKRSFCFRNYHKR